MLEINKWGKSQRRDEDLFPQVHLPLRKGYFSIEELVRELPTTSRVSFNHFPPFPLRRSFPWRLKEARSQPSQTCYCSPQPWELADDVTMIWLESQFSQREGWGEFLWLWLMKNNRGSTPTILELAAPTSGARGVLIPLSRKTSH
jgi:hypothetical protein